MLEIDMASIYLLYVKKFLIRKYPKEASRYADTNGNR